MSRRDPRQLDDLVRRLSPVTLREIDAVLDDETRASFAREVIAMSPPTGSTTSATETAAGTVVVPTRPSRRRQRAVPAVLAVVLLAIVGLALLDPFGNAPAIAGWEPQPSAIPPGLADIAKELCWETELAEYELFDADLLTFFRSDPPTSSIDVRGNVAAVTFADDTHYAICVLVEHDGEWGFPNGTAGAFRDPLELPAHITVHPPDAHDHEFDEHIALDNQYLFSYFGTDLSVVVGRVFEPATTARVIRSDGVTIEPTVTDGVFVLWWPNWHSADAAEAYDADGRLVGTTTFAAPAAGMLIR